MNNIEKYGCMKFINTAKQYKKIYIKKSPCVNKEVIKAEFNNIIDI